MCRRAACLGDGLRADCELVGEPLAGRMLLGPARLLQEGVPSAHAMHITQTRGSSRAGASFRDRCNAVFSAPAGRRSRSAGRAAWQAAAASFLPLRAAAAATALRDGLAGARHQPCIRSGCSIRTRACRCRMHLRGAHTLGGAKLLPPRRAMTMICGCLVRKVALGICMAHTEQSRAA